MRKREAGTAHGTDGGGANDAPSVVALARGLDILKAIGEAREPLGNAEIACQTGLPKATVSRLTYTLALSGYIDYIEPLGRYKIGTGGVSLAYRALSGNVVAHVARPLMHELSESLGLAVTVGARSGFQMTYLATERGQDVFSLRLTPGSSIPIMSTSMGHGYVASLSEHERAQLLLRLRREAPEAWRKSIAALRRNVIAYRKVGFCTVVGLWHPHVNAVSVPFVPTDGTPTLVFSCGGLSNFAPHNRLIRSIGPDLVQLVSQVRERLEHGGAARRNKATTPRVR